MFPRNVSFLVRPVKEPPNAIPIVDPARTSALIEAISKGAATVVAVYMGCDTLRKIIVHTVATNVA